jgi:flagellar basal-body rod protein FlgF
VFVKNRLGFIEGTETMLAQEQRMNQITNNLANVDTVGYKKENITFWEMMFTASDNRQRVGKALKPLISHAQGGINTTGNPLDLAINGEGFFQVQTPDGIRYTRNGNFTLNAEGQLSSHDGSLVLGDGGPIALASENVQIGRDGLITANGQVINQLSLVNFEDLNSLEKDGQTFFRIKDNTNAQAIPVETANIQQGHLEGANLNIVSEMTEMIDLQRAYQTQQKVIQTIDDLDSQSITRVGKLT